MTQLHIPIQNKPHFDPYLTPYIKIHSKWIMNLSVKLIKAYKAYKTKWENICDLREAKIFFRYDKKSTIQSKNINEKLDFIKIKTPA